MPTIEFTAAELAEIEHRQRESAKVIARLAATATIEEQQQLADELCPKFDRWIHARNRIRSTPIRAHARRVVKPRPTNRDREHRPGARRTSSSSRTSGTDPGDDPEPEPSLRPIGDVLERYLHALRERAHSLPVAPVPAPVCHRCKTRPPMPYWRICRPCYDEQFAGKSSTPPELSTAPETGEQLRLGEDSGR